MKYAIQVNGHPGSSQAAETAYQFSKAALAMDHQIIRVFFYYDGVLNAFAANGSPAEQARWSELALIAGIDLVVCVSACERRGLRSGDAGRTDGPMLAAGFRIGGLGQWVDACLRCDRFISFAA